MRTNALIAAAIISMPIAGGGARAQQSTTTSLMSEVQDGNNACTIPGAKVGYRGICATVDGNRTVTVVNETRTVVDSTRTRVSGTYAVEATDILLTTGRVFTDQITDGRVEARGDISYTGTQQGVFERGLVNSPLPWATFRTYENVSFTLDTLNASGSLNARVGDVTGVTSRYASVGPVQNNGVNLAGTYEGSGANGAVVFGLISGRAQVSVNTAIRYGGPLLSTTTVSTVETTRLDHYGLKTPRIIVTDGIGMNGSRITGLGAGVAPDDAVTIAQLQGMMASMRTSAAVHLADEPSTGDAAPVAAARVVAAAAEVQAGAPEVAEVAADLHSEAAARTAADRTITEALETETAARTSADTRLSDRIDAREAVDNTLSAGLAQETAARMAADSAIAARVDGLADRVGAVETRVDQLDRRIAGSTAVAVAMGGAAFLPDMRFNLTANVATYDGAHAGSVQVGAMVSRRMALNAGAATGFNRRGGTAARVGVTLGW